MFAVAFLLFASLFAFGRGYFGWDDPRDYIQLALLCSFLLGAICGFRVKD